MLKLSKKVEYGLIALLHVARLEPEQLANSREIAETYNIPPEILGKVMQALTRAEIVESIQGAKGGYRLNQSLPDVNLGDLIIAVDGPVHVAPCTCDDYACQQEPTCTIKAPINQLQDQLQQFVHGISLAQLVKDGGEAYNLHLPTPQVTHALQENQ